jgi:HlyD family secretion protein
MNLKYMKVANIILATMLIVTSCGNRNNKSDAYGNFESNEVIISSESQGNLIEFNIDEGQLLPKGQQIGIVDTLQLHLKLMQLMSQKRASEARIGNIRAQVDVQNEQLKTLLIEKKRIENMLADDAAPTRQLDDITGKIAVVESTIRSIETQNASVLAEIDAFDKQIAQLKDQIKRCYLTNPEEGTVLEKYVEAHELVVPGKALYKMANLKTLNLKAYISEKQLSSIKLGQKVTVLIDSKTDELKKLEGVICWISSTAEFTPKIIQTREERINMVYAIKVRVENTSDELKIGMPAEVVFTDK